ncbi:MAG: o-succinylbenzoate synthase [Gillisia sp.]
MTATYKKHILNFKRPSGTSRGVLTSKESWFIILKNQDKTGIGECGILRSLSIDDRPDYEEKLKWTCANIELGPVVLWEKLKEFPSIQFGVEMAFKSLASEAPFLLFPSDFTSGVEGIPINGLVWMGEKSFMKEQISSKLKEGFKCIKLKIGAIDFEAELDLLNSIRREFSSEEVELRVDANGAFSPSEALEKLKRLSEYDLHSIEQPIKQRQVDVMAKLCEKTPVPIALDEELIGVVDPAAKQQLLQQINPQYIIFKPSLIGGYRGTKEWQKLADKMEIGWWITSALESNIGLNAISQWTYIQHSDLPQGLGTGGLYTNNFKSPLQIEKGEIWYNPGNHWEVNL